MRTRTVVILAVVVLVIVGAFISGRSFGQPPTTASASTVQPKPTVKPTQDPEVHGYSHTDQGALQAAADYTSRLAGSMLGSDSQRSAVFGGFVAPQNLRSMLDAYNATAPKLRVAIGISANDDNNPLAFYNVEILRYKMLKVSQDAASIAFYTKSSMGLTDGASYTDLFGLTKVDLVWVDGQWRYLRADVVSPAPPVHNDGSLATAADYQTYITDYKEYSDASS